MLLVLYFNVIFNLNCSYYSNLYEEESLEGIICNFDGEVFYNSSSLPKSIIKNLNQISSQKIKFSSIKTHHRKRKHNRVIYFIFNHKFDWVIYNAHGVRGIHRHLLHFKISENGNLVLYKNQYYMGKETDFETFKKNACNGELPVIDNSNPKDI